MKYIVKSLIVSLLINGIYAAEVQQSDSGVIQLDGAPAPAAPEADPAPAPAAPKEEAVVAPKQKKPFDSPIVESIGCVLMFVLIALSNAGGLSGAGSNIPIMLIFFQLTMAEAVPISAFVAVVATVFRFILNFKQKHPNNPERNCINYEIVQLTMPCVFMGSFLGVMLGKAIG